MTTAEGERNIFLWGGWSLIYAQVPEVDHILMSLWEVPTGNCELLRKKKKKYEEDGGEKKL